MSDNDVESIHRQIENMEKKLDFILELLEKEVKPSCHKMSQHINFIDNIYDNVKQPLAFVCNKINTYSTKDTICQLEVALPTQTINTQTNLIVSQPHNKYRGFPYTKTSIFTMVATVVGTLFIFRTIK